jgi:hypothetical protein
MPRRRQQVMVADFDTEMVVLVPEQRLSHHLDEGLALVLDSCDGATPTADVIGEVAHGTGEETAQVALWLADAISQLRGLDLLDPAGG